MNHDSIAYHLEKLENFLCAFGEDAAFDHDDGIIELRVKPKYSFAIALEYDCETEIFTVTRNAQVLYFGADILAACATVFAKLRGI